MAVLQGTIEVSALKTECRKVGVSITKYLAAVLLWAIIQTETDGKTLKRPVTAKPPCCLGPLRTGLDERMLYSGRLPARSLIQRMV